MNKRTQESGKTGQERATECPEDDDKLKIVKMKSQVVVMDNPIRKQKTDEVIEKSPEGRLTRGKSISDKNSHAAI